MVKSIQRLWKESQQQKRILWLIVLYCIVGVLGIVRASTIGMITQGALSFDEQVIRTSVFILVGTAIFELSGTWFASVTNARLMEVIRMTFKDKTARSILEAEFDAAQSLERGDIIGRLGNDTSSISTAFDMVIAVIRSIISLLIIIGGLAFFDVRLMYAFLISIPFYFISQTIISSKSAPNIIPWKTAMGKTNALAQELLNNRTTIKTFTLKPVAMQWLEEALSRTYKNGVRGIGKLYLMNLVQFVFVFAPTFIVSITGAILVSSGSLSITALVSAILLTQISLEYLMIIQNNTQNIPQLLASTQRIFPIWDMTKEGSGMISTGVDEACIIEFDHVSFSYPSAPNQLILNDLSFTVNKGEQIGLVGTSGCGKSTLLKLLTGLYTPTEGVVRVMGVDVREWDKHALRSHLAVVSQNTFLFEDSIINNLRLAKETLTEDEAITVMNKLNLSGMLDKLPHGLDTNIGEKGSKLSGGQRQRLSIARALLRDTPIMLYDEATSALDAQSEQAIEPLLLNNDKTQMVIAHRFSTIQNMTRILLLDQGQCVDSGSHEELMKHSELYKTLYDNQQGAHHE